MKKQAPQLLDALLATFLRETFGEQIWDDSPENTVNRWKRAMQEFKVDSRIKFKVTTFPATANQLVVVKDISFGSLCGHHLFPFTGKIHVGYIPNKRMIGLSKIPRIVHHFATRPTTQETMTRAIASFLKDTLEAQGVAVVAQAQHTCMSCRGVKERNASMVTSEMRGAFLTSMEARQEFLFMVGKL